MFSLRLLEGKWQGCARQGRAALASEGEEHGFVSFYGIIGYVGSAIRYGPAVKVVELPGTIALGGAAKSVMLKTISRNWE